MARSIARLPRTTHGALAVGEQHALVRGQLAQREAHMALGVAVGQAQRQLELDREIEVDVEELGPQLERARDGW